MSTPDETHGYLSDGTPYQIILEPIYLTPNRRSRARVAGETFGALACAIVVSIGLGESVVRATSYYGEHKNSSIPPVAAAELNMRGLPEPNPSMVDTFTNAGGDECASWQVHNAATIMGGFTAELPANTKDLIKEAQLALLSFNTAKSQTEFIELPDNFHELLADAGRKEPTIDIHIVEQTLVEYLAKFNIKVIYDWDTAISNESAWDAGLPTAEYARPYSEAEKSSVTHRIILLALMKAFSETPSAFVEDASVDNLVVGHMFDPQAAASLTSDVSYQAPKMLVMTHNIIMGSATPEQLFVATKPKLAHELGHGISSRSPDDTDKYIANCLNTIVTNVTPAGLDIGSLRLIGVDGNHNRTLEVTKENNDEAATVVLVSPYAADSPVEQMAENAELVSGFSGLLTDVFDQSNGDLRPLQEQIAAYVANLFEIDPNAGYYTLNLIRATQYLSELRSRKDTPTNAKELEALENIYRLILYTLPATT
jgi:hypothetical protein